MTFFVFILLRNFLIRSKDLFSTTFTAVLTEESYPFLSVSNLLPTPLNFPTFSQFSFEKIFKNFFPMDIQISPIFKNLGSMFSSGKSGAGNEKYEVVQ